MVEPEVQVRQTTNSGRYKPGPIKYNGWKHKVREAIKTALRQQGIGKEGIDLIDGPIKFTAEFHTSNSRRYKVCDLGNYVKAIEDAINSCSDDCSAYPEGTKELGIWKDDCKIYRYGEGTGKYWEPDPALARIVIIVEKIIVHMPK